MRCWSLSSWCWNWTDWSDHRGIHRGITWLHPMIGANLSAGRSRSPAPRPPQPPHPEGNLQRRPGHHAQEQADHARQQQADDEHQQRCRQPFDRLEQPATGAWRLDLLGSAKASGLSVAGWAVAVAVAGWAGKATMAGVPGGLFGMAQGHAPSRPWRAPLTTQWRPPAHQAGRKCGVPAGPPPLRPGRQISLPVYFSNRAQASSPNFLCHSA